MFGLRVDYLLERAFAAAHDDRDAPEWPPHPERLFSALVAAAHETGLIDDSRAALRWLEEQPPPTIWFSAAASRHIGTSFVPVNDKSFSPETGARNRQPRTFPVTVPERPTVWFTWPAPAPETVRAAIDRLCAEVPRLGHSASVVHVELADPPHADDLAVLVPQVGGPRSVRVTYPGRLAELEVTFEAGQRPRPRRIVGYGPPDAQPVDEITPSPYGSLRVLRFIPHDQPAIWPVADRALRLAEQIRTSWLALLGADVPAAVHGHEGPHVALVPLPAVGHRHADGRIRGIGLAVPRRLDPEARDAVDRAILALVGRTFHVGPAHLELARLDPDEEPPRALDPTTWAAPDRWWASVTPVVLDQFPRRTLEAAAIVARSMERAGLPAPRRLRVERFSAVAGVPEAWRFLTTRAGQPRRPAFHVCVEFDEVVQGPLLVGQLRHFGVGLLKPVGAVGQAFLDEEAA